MRPQGQEVQTKDPGVVEEDLGIGFGPWDDFVWLATFQT